MSGTHGQTIFRIPQTANSAMAGANVPSLPTSANCLDLRKTRDRTLRTRFEAVKLFSQPFATLINGRENDAVFMSRPAHGQVPARGNAEGVSAKRGKGV